ncbi:MAG: YIP1 family protein [Longimicrobiales bacterium]|nr:YIP1 family protein [Longimicrobiales bacterium]
MSEERWDGGPQESDEHAAALPPLHVRLVWVFVSPGKLMDRLAETPRWLAAMFVSAFLVGLAVALTPPELMMEVQRQAIIERGGELPQVSDEAMQVMRIVFPVVSALSTIVFTFVFAGVYTVIFAFLLGDEGRYSQYLAAVAHAWFIAALFGLLVTPLRIATGDPQYTLNLASFFFFLPDGYLYNVFRALDLTQIWSTLVIAQGIHSIDRRRSFTSAAVILLSILVAFALIIARFM